MVFPGVLSSCWVRPGEEWVRGHEAVFWHKPAPCSTLLASTARSEMFQPIQSRCLTGLVSSYTILHILNPRCRKVKMFQKWWPACGLSFGGCLKSCQPLMRRPRSHAVDEVEIYLAVTIQKKIKILLVFACCKKSSNSRWSGQNKGC